VIVAGRRVPVAGTISMDNLTVDLGPDPPERGADVVLIGAQGGERVLAEEWARRLDTINYEITCGIGPRVPREYVGDESVAVLGSAAAASRGAAASPGGAASRDAAPPRGAAASPGASSRGAAP
jgi:alanine racemase